MNKQVLRAMFLEKRKTLTREEHDLRSALVCEQAYNFIEQQKAKNIHLYLPITKQREVNTLPLFERLVETKHQLVLPKVNPKTSTIEHITYLSSTKLIIGSFGVTEPQEGALFDLAKLDIVFVPLVSFDRKGFRIGYGGGFYDKFFSGTAHHKFIKVGLSITPPLDLIPYSEAHDMPLDYCITHHGLYSFNSQAK